MRKTFRVFEARFPGICETCGDGFEKGDSIMYDDDELVHANPDDCVSSFPARSASDVPACARCFLVHAGECF